MKKTITLPGLALAATTACTPIFDEASNDALYLPRMNHTVWVTNEGDNELLLRVQDHNTEGPDSKSHDATPVTCSPKKDNGEKLNNASYEFIIHATTNERDEVKEYLVDQADIHCNGMNINLD